MHSQIVEVELDWTTLSDRLIDTVEQEVAANEEKGLHNAAHHSEHGPVTYLQEVQEGSFSVRYGDPNEQQEQNFAAGSFVAFIDDEGPGHGSKVGPQGVKRTLRIFQGHLDLS